MTSKADSIYCSGLLPVLSIEAIESQRGTPLPDRVDPGDNPELKLIRKIDVERLGDWARSLPRDLAEVVAALLNGENQALIAKRLKLSEPAITKRMRRVVARGRVDLVDLRRSPILT